MEDNNETTVVKTKSWIRRNGGVIVVYATVIGGTVAGIFALREMQKREIKENGRLLGEGFTLGVAEATKAISEFVESES